MNQPHAKSEVFLGGARVSWLQGRCWGHTAGRSAGRSNVFWDQGRQAGKAVVKSTPPVSLGKRRGQQWWGPTRWVRQSPQPWGR